MMTSRLNKKGSSKARIGQLHNTGGKMCRHFGLFVTIISNLLLSNPVESNPKGLPYESDTVGGTVYDWQMSGPALQTIVNDPGFGIYIAWLRSVTGTHPTFSDRNMGFNFFDYLSRQWTFIDPTNYMNSGVSVFDERAYFGNIDGNPMTHRVYGSAYLGSVGVIVVRLDSIAFCPGPTDYLWPLLAVTNNGWIHIAMIDNATRDKIYYSRIRTWCSWDTPIHISTPDPEFPSHNIAASKISNKVVITWVDAGVISEPSPGFYRMSTNAGDTWLDPVQLPWPPAFGGDTIISFHISSLFPFFDLDDNLHIAASIMAMVGDTMIYTLSGLWDYCPTRDPVWSKIHSVRADTLPGGSYPFGYNALFASRPSLSQNINNRELYCVWEQFDSLNLEPITQLLRADIYVAKSPDNGVRWGPALRITEPDSTSKRFPFAAGRVHNDTLYILAHIDIKAGFYVQNQGPRTENPVVVLKVYTPNIPVGISDGSPITPSRFYLSTAQPNPFFNRTKIAYALPLSSSISLKIFNISGREVKTLVQGKKDSGEYSVIWDGKDEQARKVPAGIYFITLKTGSHSFTQKILLIE